MLLSVSLYNIIVNISSFYAEKGTEKDKKQQKVRQQNTKYAQIRTKEKAIARTRFCGSLFKNGVK